jgi:anti-sigma factor RsiW
MTPTPEVQKRLRRYLLGQLTDDAREEVEKDLLASDEVFEELLVGRRLVDQYLNEARGGGPRRIRKSLRALRTAGQTQVRSGQSLSVYSCI